MGKRRMTFWMEDKQIEGLKALCAATRINQAVFMREAVDDLLEKYKKEIRQGSKKR